MKTALVDVTNRANVKEHGSTSSLDHYHSSKMHCSVNSRGAMQQLQKREHLVTAGAGSQRRSQREVTRGGHKGWLQRGLTKMSSSTMSTEPCSAAWCRGVQLPWSFITISCLPAASRRDATTSTWPISAAKCRGVCKLLDMLHTFAFCWMSIFTKGNQPVHQTKQSQVVLVMLHTLAFCWMSIFTNGNQPVQQTQNNIN